MFRLFSCQFNFALLFLHSGFDGVLVGLVFYGKSLVVSCCSIVVFLDFFLFTLFGLTLEFILRLVVEVGVRGGVEILSTSNSLSLKLINIFSKRRKLGVSNS
jgi:hypothetical protein